MSSVLYDLKHAVARITPGMAFDRVKCVAVPTGYYCLTIMQGHRFTDQDQLSTPPQEVEINLDEKELIAFGEWLMQQPVAQKLAATLTGTAR